MGTLLDIWPEAENSSSSAPNPESMEPKSSYDSGSYSSSESDSYHSKALETK